MNECILLKFGELVLKGQNRYKFEDLLIKNVRRVLKKFGNYKINSAQSTIYVRFQDEIEIDDAVAELSQVFGISSLTKAYIGDMDIDKVKEQTKQYLSSELSKAKTFKVIAKRADKTFLYKSPEIGAIIGEYLLDNFPDLKAEMKTPELCVYIEVREGNIYIHSDPVKGAGGLPSGSGGHGLLMLSGGLDSPAAGYLMAKRGMQLSAIHFESPPYTSPRAKSKVERLTEILSRYAGEIKLYTVNFTEIQKSIKKNTREEYFTVIMRRYMLKIAAALADEIGAKAIITGESLGQVASQTLEAIACTDQVSPVVVFRPLIGADKQDIVDIAYKIGTYETSIEPYEDCCTVFTPKHPKTKPKIHEVEAEESKLDIDELLRLAIKNVEIKDYKDYKNY